MLLELVRLFQFLDEMTTNNLLQLLPILLVTLEGKSTALLPI